MALKFIAIELFCGLILFFLLSLFFFEPLIQQRLHVNSVAGKPTDEVQVMNYPLVFDVRKSIVKKYPYHELRCEMEISRGAIDKV